MSVLKRYHEAMIRGNCDACYRIEVENMLDGYPPELVSIGLAALDEGESAEQAIQNYIEGVE